MKPKTDILRALARTDEDRVLLAQALDKLETCRTRGYLTSTKFLDLRARSLVAEAARLADGMDMTAFAGGHPEAERAVAVFFPDYLTAEAAASPDCAPIALLRARKHPADTLTHRDYLGALMGLGLERSCIGDIYVHEEGADLVVLREVADFVRADFGKAGRKRLTIEEIAPDALRAAQDEGVEREGSVASPRLDSFVALAFGLPRGEAQELIARGQVFLNFLECAKAEKELREGDRVTVRGLGRARLEAFLGTSRKGRQFLRYRR